MGVVTLVMVLEAVSPLHFSVRFQLGCFAVTFVSSTSAGSLCGLRALRGPHVLFDEWDVSRVVLSFLPKQLSPGLALHPSPSGAGNLPRE